MRLGGILFRKKNLGIKQASKQKKKSSRCGMRENLRKFSRMLIYVLCDHHMAKLRIRILQLPNQKSSKLKRYSPSTFYSALVPDNRVRSEKYSFGTLLTIFCPNLVPLGPLGTTFLNFGFIYLQFNSKLSSFLAQIWVQFCLVYVV